MVQSTNVQGRGAPPVGTVVNGYRFDGGNHRDRSKWTQVERVDVSNEYGPGAFRFPNGTLVRVGPRGGVEEIKAVSADGTAPVDIKEFQANAAARATLMDQGLDAYNSAIRDGYEPTSIWNGAARTVEGLPLLGVGLSNLMRSPVADRGRSAELQFTDGALRTTTGANAPEPEVVRADRSYFIAPGEDQTSEASKAELRDRFRNQAVRIAGQAYIAPDRAPDGVGPINPETGLPTYPGIQSAVAAGGFTDAGPAPQGPAGPGGPGGGQGPVDPNAPRPGDVRVSAQPLAASDTPESLLAQGYVYDPTRDTYTRTRRVEVTPEEVVSSRREANQGVRRVDAAARGAADFLTFGLADEVAGGLNAVLPLDAGSQNFWQDGWGALDHNIDMQRGIDRADVKDVPVSRGAGQVAAGVAALPQIAYKGTAMAANALRGAIGGGVYGTGYGFGSSEGNALQRIPDALKGGAIGAFGGAVAAPLASFAGRATSPVVNAFQSVNRFAGRQVGRWGERAGVPGAERLTERAMPNALARAADRFAGTNRPNIGAMEAKRAQLESAVGRPVATASTVNTGGRAMLRGVATRYDSARDIAENFGQGTAEALPSRVGQQARRILSQDTRAPDDIRQALRADRSNMAREQYAEPYAQRVQIDPVTAQALSGAPGRAAIQRARAAAEAWGETDAMLELDALAAGQAQEVSAAVLDRLRQAMSGRAERLAQNPATRAIGGGVQQRAGVVDNALGDVEGLGPARAAYRDATRGIQAVDAGERFAGNTPDIVTAAMRGAPDSAQAPFRAAAARSIERAAGTTGAAPGVANRMAIPGTPQRQMMDETLGVDDAARLADAMRGERDIYRGAMQIDPGVGSQTTNNGLKAAEAAGAVGDVLSGRPLSVVRRLVGLLDTRGFNAQQSEALLAAMTDPARTDEVIGLLAQNMSRREARNLARTIRYQLAASPSREGQP